MSLTISSEGSADNLPKLAKGVYLGTCYKIVDLGTSDQEYKGVVSKKTRLHISFEITKAVDPDNNEIVMEDGRPFAVSKTYTASLFEAATLRKDLENWRDKSFSEEELKGFDIANLLGCTAKIEVTHTEASGDFLGGNPKINRLSSPPGGIEKIETINTMEAFDLSVYCEEWKGNSSEETKKMCDIFESLPAWQQEDIERSYELSAAKDSEQKPQSNEGSDSLSDLADNKEDKSEPDIPF
tara:strand:- start:776 stop:1495 length:720 start_codon:yes stop_codon:yes gene_type:complete